MNRQQTPPIGAAQGELVPLMDIDLENESTKSIRVTQTINQSDYKKGNNVIKCVAIILFLITIVIVSHVIRNKIVIGKIVTEQNILTVNHLKPSSKFLLSSLTNTNHTLTHTDAPQNPTTIIWPPTDAPEDSTTVLLPPTDAPKIAPLF